jgi:hypothetical protein
MKKFKEFLENYDVYLDMPNKNITEVENWDEQLAQNDETGKKYRVKDIYAYAKKNTKIIKDLPINDTDALEWWDKQYDMDNKEHKARMEKADTSVPVLGIRQEDGTISITDGLNRIKKAHSIEKKRTIPAYVIDKADMKDIEPVEDGE